MSSEWSESVKAAEHNQTEGMATLDKLFAVTRAGAVYSEPVEKAGQTVITLSEVTVGMGFGYGVGSGGGPAPAPATGQEDAGAPKSVQAGGAGGGGGGGGFSAGRPVAVVTISSGGVDVKPVVDVTKLGLAALTAFGAMALMFSRMNRLSRR